MDLTGVTWRKSRRSGTTGGNCVEVAAVPGALWVRDSKDPDGPKLAFTPDAWHTFLGVVKNDQA